ncbi:unnamed protein product (macronuclear) [Paramecium tetraurelia]|uniref:Protein kinase domain-containing protein n=1 Tax=Paramecium tetraurelia TaxID=5888 RepID=A0BEH8_PARTE|nr:uncharacterized protein GSPATT00027978001 [Paramecium tetraurelia]CAK56945.1 unnamed protein product [Paramecium tetraurelia]|eukprot:XP_001424343.1 hypothetical protein (macronuclear) [Paramecium tetraurelia strain d4-2]
MNSKFCQLYQIKIQQGPYIVYDKQVPGADGIYYAYNYDTNQNCCAKKIEIKDETERQKQITNHEKMSTIFHQNILRVYKVLQNKTEIYVIQEFCEMDFQKYINKKSNKLNLNEILDFISQISNGYIALQDQEIIHRDLKPENILQNIQLIIKICDFGLVKIDRIQTNGQQGTRCYKAPEITDSNYSYAADAFSFGLVLLEIIIKQSLNEGLKRQLVQCLEKNEFVLWFKNFQQMQNNKDNSNPSLENTDKFLEDILNNLLVYNPNNRKTWKQLYDEIEKKIMQQVGLPNCQFKQEQDQNQLSYQSPLSQSQCIPTQNQQPKFNPQIIHTDRHSQTVTKAPNFPNNNNWVKQQGQLSERNQPNQNTCVTKFLAPQMVNSGQNNQIQQVKQNFQQIQGSSNPQTLQQFLKDK